MYIKVEVTLNQKKESIVETKPGHFELSVNAKAERGEANKRVLELMREHFDNPKGGVKIINGHRTRVKLLKIGNE